MKPRRAAMIAVAGAVVVLSAAGIVAEKLGIDTVLLVEQLWKADAPTGDQAMPAGDDASARMAGDDGGRAGHGSKPHVSQAAGTELADEEGHGSSGPQPGYASAGDVRIAGEPAKAGAGHDTAVAEKPGEDRGDGEQAGGATDDADASTDDHQGGEAGTFSVRAHILPVGRNQPWRLFRQVQRTQDGIVAGEEGALDSYRSEMAAAADAMLALPMSSWDHQRNVISAAAYVMAGGNPEIARHVLATARVDDSVRDLLAGALAYAEGDYFKAYNLLYQVVPASLPVSVAGQVALVRAMLVSPRSLVQALEFLNEARRLAPGTLVEEAALRRQIRVLGELDDVEGFFREAATYVRRFSRSAFLSDFLRNFAFGALKLSQKQQDRVTREIERIEPWMDANARLYLFSLLARGATVFGQFDLAREASQRSLELAQGNARLSQRLNLYLAASSLMRSDRIPEAMDKLKNIDANLLGLEDARLLKAALLVAGQIRRPLEELDEPLAADRLVPREDLSTSLADALNAAEAAELPDDAMPAVIKRSEAALKQAEQALGW